MTEAQSDGFQLMQVPRYGEQALFAAEYNEIQFCIMGRAMSRKSRIAGFVLAGGASRRMGLDKALLEFHGKPLLVRAAELLDRHVDSVAIVGNPERYRKLGFAVIPDTIPNRGPLAGICAALGNSAHEWNLILACDMPLVGNALLEILVDRARLTQADAVVPETPQSPQPLCAAYHRRCLPAIKRTLEHSEASVHEALRDIRIDVITPSELRLAGIEDWQFTDADTPEELGALLAEQQDR